MLALFASSRDPIRLYYFLVLWSDNLIWGELLKTNDGAWKILAAKDYEQFPCRQLCSKLDSYV